MKKSADGLDRRAFLGCGAAALCLLRCGPPSRGGSDASAAEAAAPVMPVNTGLSVGAFNVGDLRVYRSDNASTVYLFVGRDAGGFYAFNGHCTHQGLPLLPTLDGTRNLHCSMHDSRYASTGELVSPSTVDPSTQTNLPMYPVSFTGSGSSAMVVVDTGTVLADRSARTPAP